MTQEGGQKEISSVKVGDKIMSRSGLYETVTDISREFHDVEYKIHVKDEVFVCAPNHKWIVIRNGREEEVMACELREDDNLVKMS
jgi:preprotein translocase subunit YajC